MPTARFSSTASSSRSSRRHFQSMSETGLSLGLRYVIDACLIFGLLILPLIFAGRQPIGQTALAAVAGLAALATGLRGTLGRYSPFCFSGLEWLVLLGVVVGAFQTFHIREANLMKISPATFEKLPMWAHSQASASTLPADSPLSMMTTQSGWDQLSLTPLETLSCLGSIISLLIFLVVLTQRIKTSHDCILLMGLIAISSVVMATLGLIQLATTNGKFLWIFTHPYTNTLYEAKAGFTNANHFAGYLVMGLGPLAAICFFYWKKQATPKTRYSMPSLGNDRSSSQTAIQILGVFAVSLVGLAIVLSKSRGGLVLMAISGMLMATLLIRNSILNSKQFFSIIAAGLFLCAGVAIFGDQILEENAGQLLSGDLKQLDKNAARTSVWAANWKIFQDFPILGTGLGSHRDIIQMYLEVPESAGRFTHAENSYLNLLSESGSVGLTIALLVYGWCLVWGWQALRNTRHQHDKMMAAAALVSLICLGIHGLYDFVWYVPANMFLATSLAVVAFRLSRLDDINDAISESSSIPQTSFFSRLNSLVIGGSACAIAIWITNMQLPAAMAEPHWMAYMQSSLHGTSKESDDSSPLTYNEQRQIKSLIEVCKLDPYAPHALLRLARFYVKMFEFKQLKSPSELSLGLLKQTAYSGGFTSTAELQNWLMMPEVMGENASLLEKADRLLKRALSHNPLLGDAYLQLSQIGFQQGMPQEVSREFLAQALEVEPYSPRIHFAIGADLWPQGQIEKAISHWKIAFEHSAYYRANIMLLLTPAVSAQEFIETFQPGINDLELLAEIYQQQGNTESTQTTLVQLGERYLALAATQISQEQAKTLIVAFWMFQRCNNRQRAEETIAMAFQKHPYDYEVHKVYGQYLFNSQRFSEAQPHLDWCLRRKPDDKQLREMATVAAKSGSMLSTSESKTYR